jgi:hypothetical protein
MENYIGVKRIKAEPMNRLEYNEYRGWDLPSDEDGTDEGFLVEYIDGGKANHPDHKGYISWSPKEVFENAYKISNTWEDRVKIELDELITKITDLNNALDKNLVPKSSVEILGKQLVIMETYKNILISRLK